MAVEVGALAERLLQAMLEPVGRPVALVGRSGCGKTSAMRAVARQSSQDVVWDTAFEMGSRMVEAIRSNRYSSYRAGLIADQRLLCLEHLEDLRGKAVTCGEVERLLTERGCQGRMTVITLTRVKHDEELLEWLARWTEMMTVDDAN